MKLWSFALFGSVLAIATAAPLSAQTLTPEQLDLPPETIENSPVLQRWSEEVPNVLSNIRNEPSFKTRVRLGYSHHPSNDGRGGISGGVEDVFFSKTLPLTLSAEGHTTFDGDRSNIAARANYYLFPLGNRVNMAPTVGYQHFSGEDYEREGLELGGKIMLNLSRSGASNITLSQQFVNIGDGEEMGITTLGAGYAVTKQLRLATEIQKHNSTEAKESRVGFFVEWMP
ncbi:MAG: hypothetical protein WBB82_07575 [Limnothrix sp.]